MDWSQVDKFLAYLIIGFFGSVFIAHELIQVRTGSARELGNKILIFKKIKSRTGGSYSSFASASKTHPMLSLDGTGDFYLRFTRDTVEW